MNRTDWNQHVGDDEWILRAGGRRHYNSHRQFLREYRRMKLMRWLMAKDLSPWKHGTQAEVGRAFKVSRSTAHRDVQSIIELARKHRTCPLCGQQGLILSGPFAGEIERGYAAREWRTGLEE